MEKEVLIEVKHLKKEYAEATPLLDVNAKIYKGDVICIIGPSGTGKSTFLRCINQLERPTEGEVIIDGEVVTSPKTNINKVRLKMGMVFQSFNLFTHKRVIENIMMGQIDLLHKTPKEAYDRSIELLELVGLKDKALAFPDELSGGQKQRAAIARTLAMDPEIILFDEPTSALDPTMVDEVLMVIKELASSGLTMLIVTHEMNFAKNVSNRIFFMNDGIIYEDGTPDQIFNNPQKEKTRQFINRLKVCEISFDNKNFDFGQAISKIKEFSRKNMISSLTYYNLSLICEEICIGCIMKKTNDLFNLTIEYSQSDKITSATIKYLGDEINFEKELNEIQLTLINGITNDIKKEYDGTYHILKFNVK